MPPASQVSDAAKGDDGHTTCRSEFKEGEGRNQPQNDNNSDGATQAEARGEGEDKDNRNPKHQQKASCCPPTNVVSSKKSEGFGAKARGRGIGSQQLKCREGRSRGNDVVVADAPAATSTNKRRRRGPKETTTTPEEPQETFVKGHRSSPEDSETIPGPTPSNRKKTAGPVNRRQTPVATQEKHSKQQENTNDTTNEYDHDNTAIDDRKSSSPVEGELQGQDGAIMTDCVEETPDQEYQTGKECGAEAFTVETPCGTSGEEPLSDQLNGEVSGKTVMATVIETKTNSPPSSLNHARSPSTSSRRPKGVPSPAAQLRNPPKSPRGGQTNDDGATGQSKLNTGSDVVDDSQPKENGDVGPDGTIGHSHRILEATSNVSGEEGVIDKVATDATESRGQAEVADAPGHEEGDETSTPKKAERRAKVGTKLPRGQVARDTVALKSASRSLGKIAKIKPAPRATRNTPTRLGVTTKAKRVLAENSDKDAAGSTSERVSPDHVAAVGGAEDTQRPEESEVENPLGGSGTGSAVRDSITADRTGVEEGAEEGGPARSNVADKEVWHVPTTTESTQTEVLRLEIHHAPTTAMPTQDVQAVGGDRNGNWSSEEAGEIPADGWGGMVDVASEPSGLGRNGGNDSLLPRDVVDLAEALRVEVDRLRLEKAELEDTVAQLNVAAAQLYFVEYEQMKVNT